MSRPHDDTLAVVTGGTQGLGLAIARRLAREGARGIVIAGRDAEKGARAAREVAALGTDCHFVRADLAVAGECTHLIEAAIGHLGAVNALVNAAAITTRGGLLDTDLALWEEHMNLNLRAPFLTMQCAVGHMRERGDGGSIVNIVSMAALCGQSYLMAYSVSKGGLATLTKNVANAFARDRIRCNGILLGWMDTPAEDEIQRRFHGAGDDWREKAAEGLPMGRLIDPGEVAGLVSYLLAPGSGVMTGALVEYDQNVAGSYPE